MDATAPVLAIDRLAEIFEDDREAIVAVLREASTFLRNAIDEIDIAVRGSDLPGVLRAAHGIKGSAANIGALECARAAETVESEAKAGSVRASAAEELGAALSRLDGEIEAFAGGGAPS